MKFNHYSVKIINIMIENGMVTEESENYLNVNTLLQFNFPG